MKTILALDLGKFKTVSCLLTEDHASIPVFKTIMTNPKTFEQFLLDVKPSLLVLEACGLSGWVVDLARKLGVEVLVAHPGGEAWQWGKVKRKTPRRTGWRTWQGKTKSTLCMYLHLSIDNSSNWSGIVKSFNRKP
jgi:hypothetical protein